MSALYNPPHWPYTIPLTDPVCCPWKFQELWLVDTVHAGYPSCALIGQHKLGNTKPVLWQCGLLHVYTNWYRGWIYCTTVKRFQAQCVHPEYPVAVRILQGAQSSTFVHKLVKRLNLCTAIKLFQAKCVHNEYCRKSRSTLNWLRTKKCQKRMCL
jgi:hypothetical protein